jgi:hypothetical protein
MAALFFLFLKLSLLLIVMLITLFSPFHFLSLVKSRAYEPAGCSPPCCTHAGLCFKKGIERAGQARIDDF